MMRGETGDAELLTTREVASLLRIKERKVYRRKGGKASGTFSDKLAGPEGWRGQPSCAGCCSIAR
jgi:hypothetical protein